MFNIIFIVIILDTFIGVLYRIYQKELLFLVGTEKYLNILSSDFLLDESCSFFLYLSTRRNI